MLSLTVIYNNCQASPNPALIYPAHRSSFAMGNRYLAEASKGNRGFPSQSSLEQGEKGLERFKGDSSHVSAEGPELSQTSHTDIAVCDFVSHQRRDAQLFSCGKDFILEFSLAKTVFLGRDSSGA